MNHTVYEVVKDDKYGFILEEWGETTHQDVADDIAGQICDCEMFTEIGDEPNVDNSFIAVDKETGKVQTIEADVVDKKYKAMLQEVREEQPYDRSY